MNFASLEFWLILFGGVLFLSLVRRLFPESALPQYDQWALLVLGLSFLCSESLLTGGLFLYVGLLGMAAIRCRNFRSLKGLALMIFALLCPLVFFKYSSFAFGELGFGAGLAWGGIIPMGISFYTFQTLGMVLDNRKSPMGETSKLKVMNFLGFFPQIVAGPIERTRDLLPQIERFRFVIRWERLEEALQWIILGLFFKLVMADNLAAALYSLRETGDSAIEVWFRILGLGFRIYFDFAGYSFIALGLAKLFGIDLTLNFRGPYLADSLQDFWRRWHITLSTWIRDYLYIPLGGGRTAWWPLVVVTVFILSGIWHGAGWNFILWGAVHGLGLVIWRVGGRWIPRGPAGWVLTQLVVFIAWLPFFVTDIDQCVHSFTILFEPSMYRGLSASAVMELFESRGDFLMFGVLILMSGFIVFLEFLGLRKNQNVYDFLQSRLMMYGMTTLIIIIGSTSEGDFVYFNF